MNPNKEWHSVKWGRCLGVGTNGRGRVKGEGDDGGECDQSISSTSMKIE
jgi:hypothetical protein